MRAIDMVHNVVKNYVREGSLCIDATMGRGYDTSFLSALVGDSGKVIAMDIQQSALDSTRELLNARKQNNAAKYDLFIKRASVALAIGDIKSGIKDKK